jgi:hypothetical protein
VIINDDAFSCYSYVRVLICFLEIRPWYDSQLDIDRSIYTMRKLLNPQSRQLQGDYPVDIPAIYQLEEEKSDFNSELI